MSAPALWHPDTEMLAGTHVHQFMQVLRNKGFPPPLPA